MNKIFINDSVKKLASYFDKPLYIVGGYVRDSILGITPYDIDIAAEIPPEEIKQKLKNSEFKVADTSKKLMTLSIKSDGLSLEYTAFRKEIYTKGHSPDYVLPTDILNDALRRDFTMNAVYYDIGKEEFLDPLNGIKDINEKTIKTVTDANKVFSVDGLRLMRLARMAGQTGFTIDEKTLIGAKENCALIDDIAPERIKDELNLILTADTVSGNQYGHYDALLILDKIGVLERIIPELTLGKNMKQRADFHKYDVFFHILNTVKFADKSIRLAALLHDIGKATVFLKTNRYKTHEIVGVDIAKDIMTRLYYSKKEIEKTLPLVRYHMYDLKCEAKIETLRLFIQENYNIMDDLLLLKEADSKGGGIFMGENPSITRLKNVYADMKKENVPFSVAQLQIKGESLKDIPPKKRSEVLNDLLKECAINDKMTEKAAQESYIKKMSEKYKNI